MQETTTQSRPLEVGEIEERDVITRDGRIIGHLKGAWIDTSNWTISSLIIDLKKDVDYDAQIEKRAEALSDDALDVAVLGSVRPVWARTSLEPASRS